MAAFKKISASIIFILASISWIGSCGVVYLSPPSLANKTLHAPEWVCTKPPPNPVSGRLLCLHSLVRRFNLTAEDIRANFSQSILYVNSTNILEGWYPPFTLRESYVERSLLELAANLTLRGIFVYSTACRVGSCAEILFSDRSWCPELARLNNNNLMVLETGLTEGADVPRICESTTPDEVIIVNMTAGDYNQWMEIKRGWYLVLFRICATTLAALAAALALAKLLAYIKTEGLRANVHQVILIIQFFTSLFRTNIFALDPIYAGLIFNSVAAHMTISIHIPFNFVSMLLLAMYWSEILSESKIYLTSFLQQLKIPFILASIFIVSVEVLTSVIRALPALWRVGLKATVATAVSAIVYIIFAVTISIFFLVYGTKVILRIRESAKSYNIHDTHNEQTASLRRITGLLVGNAIFNAIFVIGFIIAAVESFFWMPVGQTLGLTLIALGFLGSSLAQVAAVKFPQISNAEPWPTFRGTGRGVTTATATRSRGSTMPSATATRSATASPSSKSSGSSSDRL